MIPSAKEILLVVGAIALLAVIDEYAKLTKLV